MSEKITTFKMRFKNITIVLLLLILFGCSQHRLDFDLTRQALISCDERILIKNVKIMEADNYGVVYQLHIKDDSKGSNIVYLTRDNEGYYTGSNSYLELQPNKEYIITSVQGDSSLEMRIFTNSEGEIESVLNDFSCSE